MLFCPTCGNCLLLDPTFEGLLFSCKTCPYIFKVTATVSNREEFAQKKVDDVIGGEEMWENCPQTSVECPQCHCAKAYFMERQLRSADEPSTIFYRCVKCAHRWHDN
jgi:DNA-directed RNA polymerase III subunit RPC11